VSLETCTAVARFFALAELYCFRSFRSCTKPSAILTSYRRCWPPDDFVCW